MSTSNSFSPTIVEK
jgi:hypothetical protein